MLDLHDDQTLVLGDVIVQIFVEHVLPVVDHICQHVDIFRQCGEHGLKKPGHCIVVGVTLVEICGL